jgi:hypothetical protein
LQEPGLFRTIYVVSGIWQGVGWGSIIYLAAIAGVDQESMRRRSWTARAGCGGLYTSRCPAFQGRL